MNTKLLRFFVPLMFLAACQQMEPEEPIDVPEDPAARADSVWTITIQASKAGADTKALDLVNDGATLNAYWRSSEKVIVYKGGTLLGMLDVMPDSGDKPATATLSGSLTTTSLAVDDELSLIIPNDNWDYTGQVGTLASIEDYYDYATATVSVSSISGSSVTTSAASFANGQSVYRFGFKVSGNYIDPKSFTVSAAGGNLVTGRVLGAGAWSSCFGNLTVTPVSAPTDHFYYVAIRNESTDADTYSFSIIGSDDALYLASKAIPNTVLDAPGKFISAKSVNAILSDFSPAGGSTDTAL